jgi:16S rRNA (cytidine1402-2'-O)-methyltransferase
MQGNMVGKLSIVATPIGNLEDITLRALRTLKEAAVIYCEDTRVTSKLLARYELHTPLKRLDANVEASKSNEVIARLQKGEHVAYVSDAGTPTISDPGYRLVAAVQKELGDSVIEAIPGPSALVAALSIAGIAADEFIFFGFPPHKKGRQTLLKKIAATESVVVLYESSHRILKLLEEFTKVLPMRKMVVAREITKKFENVQRGVAADILAHFEKETGEVRGEFVVIVEAL